MPDDNKIRLTMQALDNISITLESPYSSVLICSVSVMLLIVSLAILIKIMRKDANNKPRSPGAYATVSCLGLVILLIVAITTTQSLMPLWGVLALPALADSFMQQKKPKRKIIEISDKQKKVRKT